MKMFLLLSVVPVATRELCQELTKRYSLPHIRKLSVLFTIIKPCLKQETKISTLFRLHCRGADAGFFLGGGAPVRNGVTDLFFCRIPVVSESRRSSQGGGGGCATPSPSL